MNDNVDENDIVVIVLHLSSVCYEDDVHFVVHDSVHVVHGFHDVHVVRMDVRSIGYNIVCYLVEVDVHAVVGLYVVLNDL